MAKASYEVGDTQERDELEGRLAAHAKAQLGRGSRAPLMERPSRIPEVLPDPQVDCPRKIPRIESPTNSPSDIERLRTDYFVHVSDVWPDRTGMMERLESVGVEVLYHMIAVVKCKVRRCIIIFPDDEDDYRRVIERLRYTMQ